MNQPSSVMQSRAEPRDSLDDFPTQPWATRALCEALAPRSRIPLARLTVREPTANRGHMVKPLAEYFGSVEGSDIFDYGAGFPVGDYLFGPAPAMVDWTITNPPFRQIEAFIDRALATSKRGVAIFARTSILEGVDRYNRIFSERPPSLFLQFAERVVLHKGKLTRKGSTATSYCWMVWEKDRRGNRAKRLGWIPPCRKRLERAADYEGYHD